MQNKEIAQHLQLLSTLTELHDENPFKARSYSSASFTIGNYPEPIAALSKKDLAGIRGVGPAIQNKILELIDTGRMNALDKLLKKTPEGLFELLRVRGMSGKKVRMLWKELQIESPEDLLTACEENRIRNLKGFGARSEAKLFKNMSYYLKHRGYVQYAAAEELAEHAVTVLKNLLQTDKVSLTGAIRRKDNVISKIEILLATENEDLLQQAWDNYFIFSEKENDTWKGKTRNNIALEITTCPEKEFFWHLFQTTGNKGHISTVSKTVKKDLKKAVSEKLIYEEAGFPYIEPEMREGLCEEEWKGKEKGPELIRTEDIKGILHAHSTYSDGRNSLEEMATYIKNEGFEYLGISDHSKTATYAGGLKEKDILRQHKETDRLNKKLSPFRIFKGIESDILGDGSLDYADDVLESFDFVIASIHSNFNMDKEKGTRRLIKAVENPYTTILGHMTGRLLLRREGYPVDHKKVIDACAENRVVIELNANPHRLDIDWRYLDHALNKNVMIAINPDAHSLREIHNIHYGVCSARKGGLTRKMTLNSLSVNELEQYFTAKSKQVV